MQPVAGNVWLRDLVVLLPGISGSVLQKDGKDIWGVSGQAVWAFLRSRGASLRGLALPADDDAAADDLGDGITAPRLIPDVTLIPGLIKIDGYSAAVRMIRPVMAERLEEGARDPGRYGGRLRAPQQEGYYRLRALVNAPCESPAVLEELVAVEAPEGPPASQTA
jgi:hypothetical protein